VVNSRAAPHKDGDIYRLVAVTDITGGMSHQIAGVKVGESLFLFPDCDLALIRIAGIDTQSSVALDYGDPMVGKEIGVAGYPLAALAANPQGELLYNGLIFRVARGVTTAIYSTNINQDNAVVLMDMPVLEVNFLFVIGNSGGPVFCAETGRVIGFVHGYNTIKIREKVETVTMIKEMPDGVPTTYIENLNALYSLAIRIAKIRPHLEKFGVAL
jgi:trypsin-like peptidase